MIDIAKLLQDSKLGITLYTSVFGDVNLIDVYDDLIELSKDLSLDQYGKYDKDGECLLFPSKDVRDWGCFRVKYAIGGDGITEGKKVRKLLLDNGGKELEDCVCYYSDSLAIYYIDAITGLIKKTNIVSERDYILSTGTELKLEEERPKFKVGDVVHLAYDETYPLFLIKKIDDEEYCEVTNGIKTFPDVHYTTDCSPATPEEIDKWNGETLHPNHLHYSKSKRKIIRWFLPFDRVVVRDTNDVWSINFFSHYIKMGDSHYAAINALGYIQCLPYNSETARLIGTTDDYERYD